MIPVVDQPGSHRVRKRVRDVSLDALVVANDVIEPAGLPQRRGVTLRVPVPGVLFTVFHESDQIRIPRGACDDKVQVIGHVAIRQNLKHPAGSAVAENTISLGDHSRIVESCTPRKGA